MKAKENIPTDFGFTLKEMKAGFISSKGKKFILRQYHRATRRYNRNEIKKCLRENLI
jgi:hypothetical protein